MNAPLRILCAEPENFSIRGLEAMSKLGTLESRSLSADEFARAASEYDVLMVRLRLKINEAMLKNRSRPLLAVISPTTGVDHLCLKAANDHGVQVFHLREAQEFLKDIPATAELTFGLMLALSRRIVPAVRRHRWEQSPFRGRELRGKRLGIVGLGRLGTMVCGYAQAFGMQVGAFDPNVETFPAGVTRYASLRELCAASDILTLHAPLNDSTRRMIGADEIGALPEGALLVNTARGGLVDEEALVVALKSEKLAGAAVDVLAAEESGSVSKSPLIAYAREYDNLLITPHIGGATEEAIEKTDLFVVEKFAGWLDSRKAKG